MEITVEGNGKKEWKVNKIAVIGPGIVGAPMAAVLAHGRIKIGTQEPAEVWIIQRNSSNSGWKVDSINAGKSVIGGIEPDLDKIVAETVAEGILKASHDYAVLSDADVVLVCVQTDKKDTAPDYGPMFEALHNLAKALQKKPDGKIPLIIFESTLAPSSMATVIREHFEKYGLIEGRDILLGNSPNRVMPGRLVERVRSSDKIVAGLQPQTPKLIQALYGHIVTEGTLYPTNSLTAEVVKTLENAYRDVRIAYAAEIVRYCDAHDIDFYQVRDLVNRRLLQSDNATNDPNAVPSGGLLIPAIGVGGHCLPKDGILLWWRKRESGADTSKSLILKSREINDQSPSESIRLAERHFGDLSGKSIALLGAAYRFNSEDTRNSPTLTLARQLIEKGCTIKIHDPFVKQHDQNISKYQLQALFTRDLNDALSDAEYIILCTAHKLYIDQVDEIIKLAPRLKGILDGCNIYHQRLFEKLPVGYAGIGRGKIPPAEDFVDFVHKGFRALETGMANEVRGLTGYLNKNYAASEFNQIDFKEVQRLAAGCGTGCDIADPGIINEMVLYKGYSSQLVQCAVEASEYLDRVTTK